MSAKKKNAYPKRILGYIDILGFKNLIERSVTDVKIFRNIQNSLDSMNKVFPNDVTDEDFVNSCDFQYLQFSDTFVASIDSTDIGEIKVFLNKVMLLVSSLAYSGILSRGAIVYGHLYHQKQIIYGPGIIEAYFSELNQAFYPRIIIHPEVIQMLDGDSLDYYTKVDVDGLYYIDFIKGFWNITDYKHVKYHLEKIRNTIEMGISNNSLSVSQKYEWVRKKYNDHISAIHEETLRAPRLARYYKNLSLI